MLYYKFKKKKKKLINFLLIFQLKIHLFNHIDGIEYVRTKVKKYFFFLMYLSNPLLLL